MKKIRFILFVCSCFLLGTSCNNWLDVKPNDRLEQEEMFSSEQGFENALIGVYIDLKSDVLYGKNMSMDFVENLAQHWDVVPNTLEDYTSKYDYENSSVEEVIKEVYGKYYNVILNINNLLAFVDNGVLTEGMYKLIKGEALALRAFCHLDVLRLFGPIPGEQTEARILSYARTVSKMNQPMYSWKEYIAFLEEDLNEAEILLKDVEGKGGENDFFAYRQNRMNYWACLALKARYYLWIQDEAKAIDYASRVLSGEKFRLSQETDFVQKDYVSSPEFIFALHVYNLDEKVNEYFFRAGGVKKDEEKISKDLFESDITDNRKKYLWSEIKTETTPRYTLFKYQQEGNATNSLEQIPLIRLYEMYLIIIECSDDVEVYKPLMDELVLARNISVLDIDKKDEFVAKEYQKEFYGEGQAFFYNKRKNVIDILWTDEKGSTEIYVLPLPKTELKYES